MRAVVTSVGPALLLACLGCGAEGRDSEPLGGGVGDGATEDGEPGDGGADDSGGGSDGDGGDAGGDDGGTGDGGDEDDSGGDDGGEESDGIGEGAQFVEAGRPPGGHPIITDLEVFSGRLYVTTSRNPLGEFGANVFSTVDGGTFSSVLDDPSSQGFLRLRVIDGRLYIPDGDPNGYDPGYVYVDDGSGMLLRTTIPGAVHTFDVAGFGGDVLASNGMMSGKGSLCRRGGETWPEVAATQYGRLRYMASFNGRLFVGKSAVGSSADYLSWSGGVAGSSGQPVDAAPGEAVTFRWYVSEGTGRLFWSSTSSAGAKIRHTQDGQTWTEIPTLEGLFVSDFADFGGRVYALAHTGLWESTDDGDSFAPVLEPPAAGAFDPLSVGQGISVDAMASMVGFDGTLWVGSSSNGTLYRVQ